MGVFCVAQAETDTLAGTRAFVKEKEFDFPVLYDPTNELAKRFDVKGYPTAFLIGRAGEVLWRGDIRAKDFDSVLAEHVVN